jgi:hypothetical protein
MKRRRRKSHAWAPLSLHRYGAYPYQWALIVGSLLAHSGHRLAAIEPTAGISLPLNSNKLLALYSNYFRYQLIVEKSIAAPNHRTGFQQKMRRGIRHECFWAFGYQFFAGRASGYG